MKIIFTRGNTPISKAIMKVTSEPVSHTGLLIEYPSGDRIVIHSNLLGLQAEPYEDFIKHSTVLYSVDVDHDESKLAKTLDKYKYSKYDFGAFMFLGLSLLLRSKFGILLPKSNLWQATGMFLCTEWVSFYINDKEDSMVTPYGLYLRLAQSKPTA